MLPYWIGTNHFPTGSKQCWRCCLHSCQQEVWSGIHWNEEGKNKPGGSWTSEVMCYEITSWHSALSLLWCLPKGIGFLKVLEKLQQREGWNIDDGNKVNSSYLKLDSIGWIAALELKKLSTCVTDLLCDLKEITYKSHHLSLPTCMHPLIKPPLTLVKRCAHPLFLLLFH